MLRSVDEDNVYVCNTATFTIIRIPWNFNDFLMTQNNVLLDFFTQYQR